MARIQLDELDGRGVSCILEPDVAAALVKSGLVNLRSEGNSTWRALPRGKVGCVSFRGIDVTVTSKATPASLLFYLAYAKDPGFRVGNVAAEAGDDLWAAFAETLIRTAELALRDGVLQSYLTVDDSICVIRGRIRVSDQVTRRHGAPAPVEVRYDDYTVDIAENQILRAAIRRMLGVPRLSNSARRRLAHLDGKLAGVTPVSAQRLPAWVKSRLNRRYQPALRIAELVLGDQSTVSKGGGAVLAGFVVNMATVFENFVVVAIREAFRGLGTTSAKFGVHLADGERIPMEPDVVHLRNDVPVAVFDAKYKLARKSGRYPNADIYQMLAYCTALQLRQGWLIYAVGGADTAAIRVKNGGIEIHQYAVDLRLKPAEVLERIEHIVRSSVAHLPAAS
ncbi:McrC family protein [Kribbella sp. NBC_00482]|uniref:McrC family protein n=1 Tax=Kribbella sp. NBC_00482 TaxID=2975968 RepID=UPI002E18F74B